MTQREKREYLIKELLGEQPEYKKMRIPADDLEQRQLLRSLVNVRMPYDVSKAFLEVQDAYLRSEAEEKGITRLSDLKPIDKELYLWQGDITTLAADAIVNAANSQMLGCFVPCHRCIDNAIHTAAGVQLRRECHEIMQNKKMAYGRNYEEETGRAVITKGYNLPCRYVIHTVGPIIYGSVSAKERQLLASCYRSCLELAVQNALGSIAFCCISTGEFHFPNDEAARIAVETVREYKRTHNSAVEVVFNVFKDIDYEIYRELLTKSPQAEGGA